MLFWSQSEDLPYFHDMWFYKRAYVKYMIWEPHAKSQNSKLMRQNEYVNIFKMAICVPNSEASHVMSGLEKNM